VDLHQASLDWAMTLLEGDGLDATLLPLGVEAPQGGTGTPCARCCGAGASRTRLARAGQRGRQRAGLERRRPRRRQPSADVQAHGEHVTTGAADGSPVVPRRREADPAG
jgi:hypothetical protein